MADFAIKVDGVYKNFRLPHEKNTTVKSVFTNALQWNKKNRTIETQHALKDISFEVKKGEFFGIVGRNGSGKSTLLKILAGIYQPTKGGVYVNGKLVPFIELGVGFNPELSGRDNVYLNGSLLGFSRQEIDEMYDEIVEFAELERFMDQKLKNYSSGMQVRLAFAMAIRSEADILLVDEVLAVGDADFQRKCFDYFRKLKKAKKTVVFVSHDMSAVREYCDRAILIEQSELILESSANKVATAYTKMFTPSSGGQGSAESNNKKRWGDKSVVHKTVTINSDVIENESQSIKVDVKYKAEKDVENPVFGIIVKNSLGTMLLGTNTKLKNIETGHIRAGQEGAVRWTFPNIFNDGRYKVDVAISHSDTVTQHDWWEDAVEFTVYKEEKTPFVVHPKIEVVMDKGARGE